MEELMTLMREMKEGQNEMNKRQDETNKRLDETNKGQEKMKEELTRDITRNVIKENNAVGRREQQQNAGGSTGRLSEPVTVHLVH
uniref:Uncharacterized protein n=1 Tax=Rhodnius prolixus TaxID=13249 RepID=T1I967_RHOPR